MAVIVFDSYPILSQLESSSLYDEQEDIKKIEVNNSQVVDIIMDSLSESKLVGEIYSGGMSSDMLLHSNEIEENIVPSKIFSNSHSFKHGDTSLDIEKPPSLNYEELGSNQLVLANVFSSGVNLLKTFIGAGIISLPLAMVSFGLLTGIILMTIAAGASLIGLYFYIYCANRIGGRQVTPHSLAIVTLPSLGHLLSICVALKSIGVGLTYLLLIGNIMSTMMQGFISGPSIWTNTRLWIGLFMVFLVGPLSFLKKMDHLKYSSTLGLVSVVYLTILSIVHFVSMGITPSSKAAILLFAPFSMKALSRFGIFIFAFTCHQNVNIFEFIHFRFFLFTTKQKRILFVS